MLQSLFNKVAGLREKRLQQRCISVNIAKFLRTAFLIEHVSWLLMSGEYISENLACDLPVPFIGFHESIRHNRSCAQQSLHKWKLCY